MLFVRAALHVGALVVAVVAARAQEIQWPTPNPAFDEHRPYEDLIQPTQSGLVESGVFGCGRTSGRQFHEGLDLKPVERDRRGEPGDDVMSIMAGVVRYVNSRPGSSNYGRYVVVEHTDSTPGVLSLYAHLASIAPAIEAGARVAPGAVLGRMGRSAGGSPIPKERGHLHLEVGFRLSDDFQRWYNRRKYTSRNEHGVFNGMNIVGLDFLDFMERRRNREVRDLHEYVTRLPVAATVVVRTTATPDFITRYPELLRGPLPPEGVAGWRIEFTWFGLPHGWSPLDASEAASVGGSGPQIVFHDPALLERFPCQSVIKTRGDLVAPGGRMQEALEIMFGSL